MDKVIAYKINENFIEALSSYIEGNFLKKGLDASRLAFVFEGKRPSFFLKKAFSTNMRNPYFSPRFFSIDEFVEYVLNKKLPFTRMPDMESYYIMHDLAKKIAPEIIKGREKFSQFLPWAREICQFIDTLDTEDVPSESLKGVQANAAIGYEIPENINASLRNIIALREAYHSKLSQGNSFPKGYMYLQASRYIGDLSFDDFDNIFLCGLFYMQKTEQNLMRGLYNTGKATFIFQGDEKDWPALRNTAQTLSSRISPSEKEDPDFSLRLYRAFDRHSQICTVREILKKIKRFDSTVVVLPDPETMIPLMSEIGGSVGEFNVSLGYSMKRSALYTLFELIVQAQKTKNPTQYYAKDYIACLRHPLVKNLRILPDFNTTRVLVHKVEETLLGIEKSSSSGNLFIGLKDIEEDYIIYKLAAETLGHMDIEVTIEDLRNCLKDLRQLLFLPWEDLSNFHNFTTALGELLDLLIRKSFLGNYPLNLKIAERLLSTKDELQDASFSQEDFSKEDIFKIFQNLMEHLFVKFKGTPLKGLQILGLLETRSLNFDNVIVVDANESILPRLRRYDPLIPHDVTAGLGLDKIKIEEERQCYFFTRLIRGAKDVHIIYEENPYKERSRFVERLIWDIQKEKAKLDVIEIPQVSFTVNVLPTKNEIKKTKDVTGLLKGLRYSASSINTYMQCPLQFYYKYVLRLEEKEEFSEDPEAREVGSFIHAILEDGFLKFVDKRPKIDQAFRNYLFKIFDDRFSNSFAKSMRSDAFLLEKVMRCRIQRFLDNEENNEERRVKKILCLEEKAKEVLPLQKNRFAFTYIVDRIDLLQDNSVLILDYKTGMDMPKPKGLSSLERMVLTRESVRDNIRSFQLPLYYHFECKRHPKDRLNAALYNLRTLKLAYFPDKEAPIEKTMDICMEALAYILREINDPKRPFVADHGDENVCRRCAFFYMCR